MKAMILAAGFGTRLRPVTYTLPKPMVPLCNQPLIGWAVESLIDAGIRDLIVNLHHLPEQLQRYLPATFPNAHFEFSYEPEILGTGGGIRKVKALLERDVDFFLVNGDTVQFPKFGELRAARQRLDALAALTLRHPPEGDHFTPVWFENGKITGFGEGRGTPLMFSGSHVISSRVFAYLPPNDFSSIVDEVYRPMVESGREDLAGIVHDDVWFDIGTPQRYVSASRSLLQLIVDGRIAPRNNSRVVNGSLVHDSARGNATTSVIGARTVVEGSVTDSVIWDGCRIGPGVELTSCIVAHDVEISEPMELSNSMICREDRAIPRKPEYRFENGLVIVSI
jgi:NDP-sugar pyrophosphorylase family protein